MRPGQSSPGKQAEGRIKELLAEELQ